MLKPLSAIQWGDLASEAARIADERARLRRSSEAMKQGRAAELARLTFSRSGALGAVSALQQSSEATRAAAAAAARELAEREEREAAEAARAEADAAEAAEAAAAKVEAEAAARVAEAAARAMAEAKAAEEARLARLTPRGFWAADGGVAPEVVAEWGRRAVKPARDVFVRPVQQAAVLQNLETLRKPWSKGDHSPRLQTPAAVVLARPVEPTQSRTSSRPQSARQQRVKPTVNATYAAATAHCTQLLAPFAGLLETSALTARNGGYGDSGRFRPNASRQASPRSLPAAAVAMQMALARSAPKEMHRFYGAQQHRLRIVWRATLDDSNMNGGSEYQSAERLRTAVQL